MFIKWEENKSAMCECGLISVWVRILSYGPISGSFRFPGPAIGSAGLERLLQK